MDMASQEYVLILEVHMIRCRFIAGCLDVFIVNLAAPTMYAQAIMVELWFDTSDIFLNTGRMIGWSDALHAAPGAWKLFSWNRTLLHQEM